MAAKPVTDRKLIGSSFVAADCNVTHMADGRKHAYKIGPLYVMPEAPSDLSSERDLPGKPQNLGSAWTIDEERRLYDSFSTRADISVLANSHGRTTGGIRSRLLMLGLLDEDGQLVLPKPLFTPSSNSLRRAAKVSKPPSTEAVVPDDVDGSDALVLALVGRLGPARRAVAVDVLRGLVVLEGIAASNAPLAPFDLADDDRKPPR